MDEPAKNIVENSGWIEGKCEPYQPKALRFKVLSFFWIFPSLTSLLILTWNFPKADGLLNFVRAIRLEQWVALGLLLVHPTLIYFAVRYHRTEPFTETVLEPNPDHDPKKLC